MSVKSLGFAEPDAGRPTWGDGGRGEAGGGEPPFQQQQEEGGRKEKQLLTSEV